MRAITYTRVSTGKQAESGLSLDAQQADTDADARRRGWTVVHRATDAGKSGTSMTGRDALNDALDRLARGEADALIAATHDRLARSTIDLTRLIARARTEGWKLIVLDLDLDTSTPAGELVMTVMAAMAQYESRLISARVSMTHAQRRRRGLRAGTPPVLLDDLRRSIADRHAAGESLAGIARDLNASHVPTARGGRWFASTVAHVVRSVALDAELAAVRSPA